MTPRPPAAESLRARLAAWLPDQDVLRRLRWVMLFFVPASLVPWFLQAQPRAVATLVAFLLLLVVGPWWVLTYRRDATPHLALDLLHGPLALCLMLGAPPVPPAPPIAEGTLFSLMMLLQLFGGPVSRFLLRTVLLSAAYLAWRSRCTRR